MRMSKKLKKCLWFIAAISLILLTLAGCQKKSTSGSTDVAGKLSDKSVTEVNLDGETSITETIVVNGEKTLNGNGNLIVSEEMKDEYAIVIPSGSALILDGITIDCQRFASAIRIEEGGELVIRNASINEGANHNIYNAGILTIEDGAFTYCGACNLVNEGTAVMSGGTFTSNGGSSKAVVYNKGDFTMTGGKITEGIACNLYLEDGSEATIDGGTIDVSGADGIYVAKGASLTVNNENTRITNCGLNGVTTNGKVVVNDAVFMSNGGDNIENLADGDLTVNGGQYMSAMAYGINNRGTMHMTGGSITGSAYSGISNKGTCTITGGEISYNNWRGISNKSGARLYVEGDVTFKANVSSHITNDLAGYAEVKGVTLNAGGSNQLHNRGEFYISDSLLVDSGSNAVNNVGGYLEMRKVVIDTTITNNGMYMTGGEVKMYDCEIRNVTSRAIQNAGAKFYAENLTIDNAAKSAVGNKTNPNNGTDGTVEIDGLVIKNPQGVLVNSEGNGIIKISNSTLPKTKGSTGIRITNGTVTLENVEMKGTTAPDAKTSIHAIYLTGGKVNLYNCTIHDTDSRAIQNAGATVYAENLTVYNTGGTALGNKAYEGKNGNMTIKGLDVSNSEGNHLINECSGTINVINGNFGLSVGYSAIKINEDANGKIILNGCTIEGTARKDGDTTSSIHAIYPLSGSLEIYDCTVKNVQTRAIQNKGCTITIDGLDASTCGGVVIGNEVGEKGQSANITINDLVVKDTESSSIVNNAAGTTITVANSTINATPKTNISATAGTIILENTTVLGTTQDDKPAINVDKGATVIVRGKDSYITNPSFRAVVNHGNFTLEDGSIANAVSTASAGGVYTDGVFTMTGGSITGNQSASVGGGVNVVKTGSMIMTGGTISGNIAKTKGGAINIESSATCTILGGTISGNTAGTLANNVHHDGGALAVGKNVSIKDIYLAGGKSITVDSQLASNVALTVMLDDAAGGRVVLEGNSPTAVADASKKVVFVPALVSELYLDTDGMIRSTSTEYVARIGDVYYTTLSEAFGAVPTNGTETTIVVLKDITLSGGITLESGKKVVLTDDGTVRTITRGIDSTGAIISGRLFTVSGGAELTVKGSKGTDDETTLIIDGNDDGTDTYNTDSQIIAIGTGNNAEKSAATFTLGAGAALQNNKTKYGGAIVAYGTFNMNGGIIRDNRSIDDNAGAVAIQTWGRMTMTGGTITGNSAAKAGGAIHTKTPGESGVDVVFTMTGGTITGNTAGTHSGAITVQNTVVMTGGTIEGNTSSNSGNDAGSQGIRVSGSKDIAIGGSVEVDEVWLAKSGRKIIVDKDLTAEDASIMVTLEAGYSEGYQVLTGSKVAQNYQKFTLPEAVRGEYSIGADGKLHSLATDVVARIGSSYYNSLSAAFAAAPTNGAETTIVVMKNITISSEIKLEEGQNIVLTDDGTARTLTRSSSFTSGHFFELPANAQLTLKASSGNDANPTLILDGNSVTTSGTESALINVGTGNTAAGSENAVLTMGSGVVLQNNYTSYCGAVRVYGQFIMNGGIIQYNIVSGDNGGAVAVKKAGSMEMNGGTIQGNTSKRGGAIHVDASNTNSVAVTITGGTITGNATTELAGAITAQSTVVITGGTIIGNTAATAGTEGIWVHNKDLIIGDAAVIDAIYLKKGRTIAVDSNLTGVQDSTIMVSMEAGYSAGTQVLSGNAVPDNYRKFALPESAGNVRIGSAGAIEEISIVEAIVAFIADLL